MGEVRELAAESAGVSGDATDPNRQTGRTTRMLRRACGEAAKGFSVIVVGANLAQARLLMRMTAKILPGSCVDSIRHSLRTIVLRNGGRVRFMAEHQMLEAQRFGSGDRDDLVFEDHLVGENRAARVARKLSQALAKED